MKRLVGHARSISFQLRWIFMSALGRYVYLWANTNKLGDLGYTVRNPAISITEDKHAQFALDHGNFHLDFGESTASSYPLNSRPFVLYPTHYWNNLADHLAFATHEN